MGTAMEVRTDQGVLTVEPVAPRVIHVRFGPAGYAGQQRNAAITWSGDTMGDWDAFRCQIRAGLNFMLSGIPYWSADIGGGFGGKPTDPAYAELFTRWFQFGVFDPMFRVHGTGDGKQIWQFDAATQKILRDYIEVVCEGHAVSVPLPHCGG